MLFGWLAGRSSTEPEPQADLLSKEQQSTATQDGVALMKAFVLLILAFVFVAGGSLLAAFLDHWLAGAPLWVLGGVALWKARPALVREFRAMDNAFAHPIAVLHTTEERTLCSFCGNPTLEPEDDTCRLCDWPVVEDEAADVPIPSMQTAKSNFRRYLTVYSPAGVPEWAAFTAEEQDIKRRLLTTYGRVRTGRRGAWFKARSLEAELSSLRYRLASEIEPE